jgi:hypothetical protein
VMWRRTRLPSILLALAAAAAGGVYLVTARQLRSAILEVERLGCGGDADGPPATALWEALERLDHLGRLPWLRARTDEVRDHEVASCRSALRDVCRKALDEAQDHAVAALRAERDRRLAGPHADRGSIHAWYDARYDDLLARFRQAEVNRGALDPQVTAAVAPSCAPWRSTAAALERWSETPSACPACDAGFAR